jgi:hypothetical protein
VKSVLEDFEVIPFTLEKASVSFKARTAGALYFLSVLFGGLGERFLQGSFGYALGLIALLGMVAMTLLFYGIFQPVNKCLSLLAASFNLVGIVFEALRWNPQGVDIAIVFLGLFCILIGYLIFRSAFLPRILGALMAIAGLGWLTYLSPQLANYLSPYNLAAGLLGQASLCLWFLIFGVNSQRWKQQAGAANTAG